MRLVFAGTPAFARTALQALLEAKHDVALVLDPLSCVMTLVIRQPERGARVLDPGVHDAVPIRDVPETHYVPHLVADQTR